MSNTPEGVECAHSVDAHTHAHTHIYTQCHGEKNVVGNLLRQIGGYECNPSIFHSQMSAILHNHIASGCVRQIVGIGIIENFGEESMLVAMSAIHQYFLTKCQHYCTIIL